MEFHILDRDYRFIPNIGLSRIVVTSEFTFETEEQWSDVQRMIEDYMKGRTQSARQPVVQEPQEPDPAPKEDESVTVFNTINLDDAE